MFIDTVIALVHNVSLLLAIAVLFDLVNDQWQPGEVNYQQIPVGVLVGLMCIAAMATPWVMQEGIVFDARSILLSLAGLFFGVVVGGIAAGMAVAYRLWMGGGGALMGIAAITASVGIGVIWRKVMECRSVSLSSLTFLHLWLFGLVVHVAVIACTVFLPREAMGNALRTIPVPFLGLFPIVTAALGRLLVNRIRRGRQQVALEVAVRERDTLLLELRHRVKNSMATISSMISLERNLVEDPNTHVALDRIGGRVSVLSRLYDILHQTGADEVHLDVYLRALVSSITGSHPGSRRVHVTQEYDAVVADSRTASSIGLIVNELITNAFKYAFPAGREGNLSLRLRALGAERIELIVADDGVGMAGVETPNGSSGFGLQLVEGLAQQHGGTVARDSSAGTRVKVTLRLA